MLNKLLGQLFQMAVDIEDDEGLDYLIDDIYTAIDNAIDNLL